MRIAKVCSLVFISAVLTCLAQAIDRKPVIISRVDPTFPYDLKLAIAQGKAVGFSATIQVLIDRDGSVIEAKVLKADHPAAGKAAKDAVMQWKFSPGIMNDKPVKVRTSIPIWFGTSPEPPKQK